MTSRIRIFDHYMQPINGGDFTNLPTTTRAWILNAYGLCDISIGYDPNVSQASQAAQERFWQYGNLLHIEHIPDKDENGNYKGKLPDWVGIILPQRDWDQGILHLKAYSAESILAFRAMPYLSVKGTPRTIFSQILQQAHAKARNIIIQPGQLDDTALTFSDNLRTNAYDHIKKLTGDAQMDWSVTGSINERGTLDLFANLYARKGIDTALTLNNNNTELAGTLLSEQGTINNQIFGYSQAQTPGSRYTKEIVNQASMDDYGPLQLNQVFMGRQDPTSVQNAAQARADSRSRPVKIIKRNALDRKNTFDFLDAGNVVTVKDTSVGFHPNGGFGFESQFRIISMDYNDLSNKVPLNLEFVKDVDIIAPSNNPTPATPSVILWDDGSAILWDDGSKILWDI